MDTFKIILGGIVGGLLVLLGTLFIGQSEPTQEPVRNTLGGRNANVTSITNPFVFDSSVTNSYTTSTSTNGNATLQATDFINYDVISISPVTTGNTTLTLPASSTLTTWLPNAGDHQKVCFVNATTSSSAFITFSGGTGTTAVVASSSATALGSKRIDAQKIGCFDFVRAPASATTFDIIGAFTVYQ